MHAHTQLFNQILPVSEAGSLAFKIDTFVVIDTRRLCWRL